MKTIPAHHPDDLTCMRADIEAVVQSVFPSVSAEGLDWLDTDTGKNHRHILGLWDAYEDAEMFDEWARRNPPLAALYLDSVHDMAGDEAKARAMYEYGFDLFDDVVEILRGELE